MLTARCSRKQRSHIFAASNTRPPFKELLQIGVPDRRVQVPDVELQTGQHVHQPTRHGACTLPPKATSPEDLKAETQSPKPLGT